MNDIDDKPKCILCGRSLRIFKKEEKTGDRQYHKKCWLEKQKEYNESIAQQEIKLKLLIEERERQDKCFSIFNKYGTYIDYEKPVKDKEQPIIISAEGEKGLVQFD